MRVQVLNDFQHNGSAFITDEVRIVDNALGEYFCRAGWVKDLDGNVVTNKPNANEVILEIQDVLNSNILPDHNVNLGE